MERRGEPSNVFAPPDPPLTDGVVMLRPWLDSDVEQLTLACQDPDIQRFIPIPRPYGSSDAQGYVVRTRRQWEQGTKAAFAVVDASAPTIVFGAVNLAVAGGTGNSAYWIAAWARRRGIAERALRLLSRWAFDALGLGVVILEIHPENVASQHVATAAGFHVAGHLEVNNATGEHDHLIYSRLAGGATAREPARQPEASLEAGLVSQDVKEVTPDVYGTGVALDTVHRGPRPPDRSEVEGPLPHRAMRLDREPA